MVLAIKLAGQLERLQDYLILGPIAMPDNPGGPGAIQS